MEHKRGDDLHWHCENCGKKLNAFQIWHIGYAEICESCKKTIENNIRLKNPEPIEE